MHNDQKATINLRIGLRSVGVSGFFDFIKTIKCILAAHLKMIFTYFIKETRKP